MNPLHSCIDDDAVTNATASTVFEVIARLIKKGCAMVRSLLSVK